MSESQDIMEKTGGEAEAIVVNEPTQDFEQI